MDLSLIMLLIAGPLFLVSIVANIFVKITMRPKQDSDFDDYYYEVEDQHPGYAKYKKYSQITYTTAIIAVLLLFTAMYL